MGGTGFGLVGLDERVTALGGRLSARKQPDGGFQLTAHIPDRPAAAPAGALRTREVAP